MLFLAIGGGVAVVSVPLAAAAGPPYLSLESLSPWIVTLAIGLFTALFATPFAIHGRLSDELERDARWERALLLWGAAIWSVRPDWLALLALMPAALHLANQALRADPGDGELALKLFRSNRSCGFLVCLAMLVVGLAPH